jgi:SpoIIAA-like
MCVLAVAVAPDLGWTSSVADRRCHAVPADARFLIHLTQRTKLATLIETVTDLPAGTLGFSASEKITSDEYCEMMEPIYAALERGEKLNIYFELADDFHGLDSGALWQDMKAAWRRASPPSTSSGATRNSPQVKSNRRSPGWRPSY